MKVEELQMMSDRVKRADFKDKISPHLEVVLQYSLSLTKDGRDATRLMRETMVEAYQIWNESVPKDSCNVWLHNILTRRFFNGFQQHSLSFAPIISDNVDDSLIVNNRLFNTATINPGQESFPTGESDEDVNYLRAVAGLPTAFRSAMILSYLEGFTNKEIANLAGVQPHAIESLLNRGRQLLRKEFFAHLMGSDSFDSVTERAMVSG
jgi:RNA polymerase sigma-70 factor, ECF subfamily